MLKLFQISQAKNSRFRLHSVVRGAREQYDFAVSLYKSVLDIQILTLILCFHQNGLLDN